LPPQQHQHQQATEKQAVAAGKAPFYLKKSEVKKRELLAKYEELKDSGGLEKFMAKRRKKNAAKDHRYVPSTRRPAAGSAGGGGEE
jgi:ribosomal RNA-processing protein 36